jgi:elongation factor G
MPAKLSLIKLKIEPKSKTDFAMFSALLTALCHDDPNASCSIDVGSGEVILGGKSEQHLDDIISAVNAKGIAVSIGAPQICYRETIQSKVIKDYTHKRQFAGVWQFARIILDVEPTERGAGYEFVNKAPESSIPRRYLSGIDKGLDSILRAGILIGFPVVDIKITLLEGAYHEEDSSPEAFEIATRQALREAFEIAGAVLLEPMMKVEITSPEDFIGTIIGDLKRLRATITGTAQHGRDPVIRAIVSLSNMFGYANSLMTMTQGHGRFTMKFDHYAIIPGSGGNGGGGDDDPDNFPPAIGMRA